LTLTSHPEPPQTAWTGITIPYFLSSRYGKLHLTNPIWKKEQEKEKTEPQLKQSL